MIYTKTRTEAQLQFAVLISEQVVQFERNAYAIDLLFKESAIVAIIIAYTHTITQSRVALEAAVVVDTYRVLCTLQLY